MTDEENIIPICCWCQAPLVLKNRIAWCSGRKECRDRQRACGIAVTKYGKKKWLFVPSPKQTEVMESKDPNLFVWGNRGGGKSVCLRWLCHQLASGVPGFKYAILRTSFPELLKNHLAFLKGEMDALGGETYGFSYNKTEHICYYPEGSMGFYAQCATDGDVKKILGAEVALVIFDEAPTFQWDHMRLIAASIRVNEGSNLTPMTRYLGNPIGESIDELWRYFMDKDVDLDLDPEYRPQYWKAIEMRVQDNPHLNAKVYWRQFSGLAPHYLKAWREGIRIEENSLFEFLPTVDGRPYHVIDYIPALSDETPLYTVDDKGVYHFPDWVRVYRAYDHGFWPDPAVCLWFAVYGRRVLCFKEKTWYRTLAPVIAKEIVAESKGMKVTATYCDPSIDIIDGSDVLSIKQKMENQKLPLDCAINDRELFPDAIHTMLDEKVDEHTPRTQFLRASCPMTIKYIPRMKFDEKNPAKMADHKMDHWPVTFAYFGMMQIPTTRPSKRVGRPKEWELPTQRNRGAGGARLLQRHLRRQQKEPNYS